MNHCIEYEDKDLLTLLQHDDENAFTEIYRRYWKILYTAANSFVSEEAICNDTVQDIFVWLWENRKNISVNSLKPYLLTAVKFKMLNIIRQGKIRENVFKAYEAVADNILTETNLIEVQELRRLIETFISALPDQAAKIFYLSRQEQLSHKEIALRMELSEKTVKNQINISLKKFRIILSKHFSMLFQLFF